MTSFATDVRSEIKDGASSAFHLMGGSAPILEASQLRLAKGHATRIANKSHLSK
jgi:hypothetical protein